MAFHGDIATVDKTVCGNGYQQLSFALYVYVHSVSSPPRYSHILVVSLAVLWWLLFKYSILHQLASHAQNKHGRADSHTDYPGLIRGRNTFGYKCVQRVHTQTACGDTSGV